MSPLLRWISAHYDFNDNFLLDSEISAFHFSECQLWLWQWLFVRGFEYFFQRVVLKFFFSFLFSFSITRWICVLNTADLFGGRMNIEYSVKQPTMATTCSLQPVLWVMWWGKFFRVCIVSWPDFWHIHSFWNLKKIIVLLFNDRERIL